MKKKIKQLSDELHFYNNQYYNNNISKISDFKFDQKLKELQRLEKQYPEYTDDNSPTKRVGSSITKEFKQIKHKYPMGSLNNTYSRDEIISFINRCKKELPNKTVEFVCELKYDGVAISLLYKDGKLIHATTRGDGIEGDDVTNNVKTIKTIPLVINNSSEFEIKGEIVMPHKSFNKLNEIRKQKGDSLLANPRNAASGSIKQLKSATCAERNLDCLFYSIYGNLSYNNHLDNLTIYGDTFNIPNTLRKYDNIDEIFNFIDYWNVHRKELPYDIDGIVIKVNNIKHQEKIGYTSKSPKWAVAYKYKAEQVPTELLSIDYQIGRTGAITPVANLKPVLLSGSTIKRASLHNEDNIINLDIRIGDFVYIEKSGEIIPQVIGVDLSKRKTDSKKIEFPTKCPDCETQLIRGSDEANHYCLNEYDCPSQIKGRLEHFTSKKSMGIDGLGEGTIKLLYDNGLINNFFHIYNLTYDKLIGISNVNNSSSLQHRSVTKLLQSIENSKKTPYYKVLSSLGIKHVGLTMSKKLCTYFNSIDKLKNASYENLTNIESIGDTVANDIIEYFENIDNVFIIDELKKHGLKFENMEIKDIELNNKLNTKKYLISGKFNISRIDIKKLIEINGGINTSSISKNTDYIIVGENMGPSKKEKALKLNIPMITEKEFLIKIK